MVSNLALLMFCQLALCMTTVTSKACGRPPLTDGMSSEGHQRVYVAGYELRLSCKPGYVPTSGYRTIVCTEAGEWTRIRLRCIQRECPIPRTSPNGDMEYTDNVYQSRVNYSCKEGYILHGANSSECLADGTWSEPTPECKPVTCGLPPMPIYGKMVYDRKLKGSTVDYGFGGKYHCLPPFVLFGNERGSCTAHGNWTETPECKIVTCPPPTDIENGYMTTSETREHGYKERIRYGCNRNFVLDGPVETECQETGEWSLMPVCRGHCTLDIKRGKVLYDGKKVSIKDLEPKQINHFEMISFYCMNEDRNCSYPVSTQCLDGKLHIPACFIPHLFHMREPGLFRILLFSGPLPSEMPAC